MPIVPSSDDGSKAFGVYVTFNSVLGLWPPTKVDFRLNIRVTIAVIEVIIMTACISYELMQNCGDAEDSLDGLLIVATALMGLVKLTLCNIHREDLTFIVTSAIRDWSSIETIDHRHIMAKYERFYKRLTYFYGTAIVSCVTLHFLNVLIFNSDKLMEITSAEAFEANATRFVSKKRYPLPSTCTFGDVSDAIYFGLVFNQLIQAAACCLMVVGSDTLFFAIAAHVCGQFEILKIRFSDVTVDLGNKTREKSRREMNALISRHQHLLNLTELVETAYNKIILMQLVTSMTSTSAAGYNFVIALKTINYVGAVKSFMVMQSVLLQSLIYTCIGEALQNGGEDIMHSLYDGSSYELPRSLSKDLLFIMMRTSILPRLTAGKFFDMTRETFMAIVKITFSYISALQLMIKE